MLPSPEKKKKSPSISTCETMKTSGRLVLVTVGLPPFQRNSWLSTESFRWNWHCKSSHMPVLSHRHVSSCLFPFTVRSIVLSVYHCNLLSSSLNNISRSDNFATILFRLSRPPILNFLFKNSSYSSF